MCTAKELGDYNRVIEDFKIKFFYLYKNFKLSFTLKVHVILHHFSYYFSKTGKTFKDTNDEFTESAHSTLRKSEEQHNFKVIKNLGTPFHQMKSQQSLNFFNARRSGGVSPIRLRRKC